MTTTPLDGLLTFDRRWGHPDSARWMQLADADTLLFIAENISNTDRREGSLALRAVRRTPSRCGQGPRVGQVAAVDLRGAQGQGQVRLGLTLHGSSTSMESPSPSWEDEDRLFRRE